MKVSIFILPLLFCSTVMAQRPDPNNVVSMAKFNIIKRSVEFLSTDTASFKSVTKHTCDGCTGYDELKKFAQKITNADQLIDKWYRTEVGGGKEELNRFTNTIIAEITTGPSYRAKRLTFPGYPDYKSDLAAIVNGETTNTANNAVESNPDDNGNEQTVDSANVDEERAALPAALDIDTKSNKAEIPWLYVGATLCGVLLALYFYVDSKKLRTKKDTLKRQVKDLQEQLSGRDSEFHQMSREIKTTKEELTALRQALEDQAQQQADERKQYQQKIKEARQPSVPETPVPANFSKGFVPMIKYARYADKGDGFSSADLLDSDDNETIFEITITSPATGAFRICKNRQAQRYALSNASYFFGSTCLYDTLPLSDSVIVTNKPGELVLNGDKWTIRHPAKISFN